MREEIIKNMHHPMQLEKLYRENKSSFRKAFNILYPDIRESAVAQTWNERLNYESEEITWGTKSELFFVLAACFIAGLIAKIPDYTSLKPDYFYPKNMAFIFLPMLTAWFAWKQNIHAKKLLFVSVVFIVSCVYINLLPDFNKSDTSMLACIHLPLSLWAILGFIFIGNKPEDLQKRVDFLRYNGDLLVMIAIILIAGGILTGVTFRLFELIDLKIEDFYVKYVVVWGLSSAPIIGTWLVQTNPQLVNKVSPVIAKLFTPLVLIMLIIYLIAVIVTRKDPYNDREFLIIFNLLLAGVMAIILFSIAGTPKDQENKINTSLLFALSIVTILVSCIALSAVVFRIAKMGITPNRLAVSGGNLLMLINLLIISYRLYKTIKYSYEMEKVENSLASFLPVYWLWTLLVTFLFPLIFRFS